MLAKVDILERTSRWITLAVFGVAAAAAIAAPLLAIGWAHRPFPGFAVEQTLVVSDENGQNWTARSEGLTYPQVVTRIGGVEVTTAADFDAVLESHAVGDQVAVLVKTPAGDARLFPTVTLMPFPPGDLMRLFWLPYLIGLAYLGIGFWIYLLKGQTRPGRALSFFCACTAIGTILLFDLSSTHLGVGFWTFAIAMTGGALISLSLRFPREWRAITRRPWLMSVPYAASAALAIWCLTVLHNTASPWSYIQPWGTSYRYAAFGIVAFLITVLYHAFRSDSIEIRRQARIILLGSLLAFSPLTFWFISPLLGISISFNARAFLPSLILFPLSVGVAILRYRLWEIDTIVNRTLVYGALTAILAGVFTALIGLAQRVFVAFTGEKSDAALVITTLIVAAASAPIKTRLQAFVDRQFKDVQDETREVRAFGEQVRTFVEMSDVDAVTRRLLDESARALGAQSGAVSLFVDGKAKVLHTVGSWRGEVQLALPLTVDGERFGMLMLGRRMGERSYVRQEAEALQEVVTHVSRLIRASRSSGVPSADAQAAQSGRGAPRLATATEDDRPTTSDAMAGPQPVGS